MFPKSLANFSNAWPNFPMPCQFFPSQFFNPPLIINTDHFYVAIFFLRHFRGTMLGKMISSIISCLRVFVLWAVVAVFIWFPYAITQHNLRYPNRIVNSFNKIYSWDKTIEKWDETGTVYSYEAMTLKKLLRDAFFNMFGELFIDQFDPARA